MRIIITGGTGLIGRSLAENLVTAGYEVIVLSRHPDTCSGFAPSIQLVKWDACTPEGWGHLITTDTCIINLAGANLAGNGFFPSRWTNKRRQLICDSRLDASRAVVSAIAQSELKPALVVQSSAVGYYGYDEHAVFTELSPHGLDWAAQFTATLWEPSTWAVRDMGVRWAALRMGVVLSKQGGALPRLLLPFRLYLGGPMGKGCQWYSWIHIDDAVRAIRFLIENPETEGAFNLTAPEPVTNADMAKYIGRLMHRSALVPVPGFAMRLAFGEVADVVLKGQRVLPERLLDQGFVFQYPDIESALAVLMQGVTLDS